MLQILVPVTQGIVRPPSIWCRGRLVARCMTICVIYCWMQLLFPKKVSVPAIEAANCLVRFLELLPLDEKISDSKHQPQARSHA